MACGCEQRIASAWRHGHPLQRRTFSPMLHPLGALRAGLTSWGKSASKGLGGVAKGHVCGPASSGRFVVAFP